MPSPVPHRATPALLLLLDVLAMRGVEYRVSGGLAARFYGSRRPLEDIDIDVYAGALLPLVDDLVACGMEVVEPVHWYRDAHWSAMLATLAMAGQPVDLVAVDGSEVRDAESRLWVPYPDDLSTSNQITWAGRQLRVIARHELAAYKKSLARVDDVDDLLDMARHIAG